ncbi:MAG: glucose-6-phosphate isomerase [Rhodospirillales bacterium]
MDTHTTVAPLDAAWARLEAEAARLAHTHLRDLFAADAGRFDKFSFAFDDLLADFSKEKIDGGAMDALLALADAAGLEAKRAALFAGEPVNTSENRAALHMALRDPEGDWRAKGEYVAPAVMVTQERMLAFAENVRAGGQFDAVVSLGTGGSHLGPETACAALAPFADGPPVRFAANIDGADLADALSGLNPLRTLVIVQSKTFTTAETMANAHAARAWLGEGAGERMAAVTADTKAAAEFGVRAERIFTFADWVGGRYSVWGPAGLPLAVRLGAVQFRAFLKGAHAVDRHFAETPLAANLPVLMGLTGVWRRSAMGCAAVCIAPYDSRLARFPAYLQQLVMESNGKGVDASGAPLVRAAAPVVFGEPGTNAQHSFFQLLHQGVDVVPVDFLLAAEPAGAPDENRRALAVNALAQARALAFGADENKAGGPGDGSGGGAALHKAHAGDRPSTMIVYGRLDPFTLGRLIALYEHKTFVEAVLWGVNPFDQWGVELGKTLAKQLAPALAAGREGGGARADNLDGLDGSTRGLIEHLTALRGE